ncbi:MAG: GNAT family N-acetyltransferase [Rhodocyclaceae bacterium]|nr:GNAT family N-acetyltransferase [Rhodocyclaceae bacterium]
MIDNATWQFIPAADFPAAAGKWQALCDATLRTPLLSADFVATALLHFGRGDELVCIASGPDGPVAGAILQRKNPLVWQTFQPSQMPLGPWLQPIDSDFATVAQSLLRRLSLPAMVLAVTQLDPDFYPRPTGNSIEVLDSITTGKTRLAADMQQFMLVGGVNGNKSLVSELMRRMRKAEKDHGPITLQKETTVEAADEFVSQYASTESRGWKGLAGTALIPKAKQANFYADLMRRFATRNAARMYTLKFGATPVARQIAITGENVLILLKTTYEPEFRNLGPGVTLQYRLIDDVHQNDKSIRIIEPYGPFNESQKLWVSGTRVIYHANVYRFQYLAALHRYWMAKHRHPAGAA